jgi:multicomponent Na+:H+ antiporter subunit D
MRGHLPILPALLPLAGALLSPILGLRWPGAAWPLAVAAAGAAALAAAAGLVEVLDRGTLRYAVGGWPPPWGIEVVLDRLSGFTATLVAGVATLSLLASGPATRRGDRDAAPGFYALALLVLTGLLGIVISGDLFNVFVFLEVASLASYALVASGGGPALAAAFRYLVLGTVGASFYLLGVGFLYTLTGTLNMADLSTRLPAHGASPLLVGGTVFIAVGLAIKMGLFPLHGWLPDAYTHAPPAAALLLAPIGTKAAAYALARVLLYVLEPAAPPLAGALAWLGALAIVAGGVLAVRQADARRLLAYSSVSQIGYIALGLGIQSPTALAGAYLHILGHAVAKAALFVLLAGTALQGRGPAAAALSLRTVPVAGACAVIAALSMVGVPPAAGFFSKWYLLQAALEARELGLVVAILLGGLLAAAYTYRLTETVWFGDARDPVAGGATADAPRIPGPVLTALALLAIGSVAVGLLSAPIVSHVLLPAAPGGR